MEKTIEIPEGYETRIEGNKVILERKSEDERIRQAIESIIRVYGKTQGEWIAGYDMDTLVVHLRDAFASLERQKEKPICLSTGARKRLIFSKRMMTINEVRRCKRIIASPNYYRDRAIQMGETYGALKAEYFLLRFSSPTEYLEIDRIGTKLNRYKQKCVWYARRVAVWNENLDYNT